MTNNSAASSRSDEGAGSSRRMFAFGRDGLAASRLGAVSAATGVPRRALATEMIVGLVLLTAFRLAGTPALNVFFYLATIGTLSLLVLTAVIPRSGPAPGRGSPRPRVIRRRACGKSPLGGS